jgi:hypothetical protein
MVAISPAGRQARDAALSAIEPIIRTLVDEKGADDIRAAIPVLREMRLKLESGE